MSDLVDDVELELWRYRKRNENLGIRCDNKMREKQIKIRPGKTNC